MYLKEYTKSIIFKVFRALKPLVLAIALIAVLQTTGVISSISYYKELAILKTGLKDADDEADTDEEVFDYNFLIRDLQGNKIDFAKFKGKVIFLNLWATWCGPCRAEMAGIENLYKNVKKDNIVFVMLSLDRDSDTPKIISYVTNQKFTFTSYQPSGYLPKQLQVPSIPTTFVISPEGKIVRKEVGGMRYDTSQFQKFLEGLSAK